MTLIKINVVDVAGGYHPGDRVLLRAPSIRGDGSAVISTAWRPVGLQGDGTGSETVSPGPLEVQLDCKGMAESRPILVIVPDQESVTLRSLLEDDFVYTPPVVSEVASLRDQAVEARDRTEDIATAFGSLEGVTTEVQAAKDAATAAAGSAESTAADRLVVEQAASSASWSGDQLTVLGVTSPSLTGPRGFQGDTGAAPHVGANGNWWVEETDTGVMARGPQGDPGDDGVDGDTPHIGDNGNWWVGTVDTGYQAQGEKGDKGDPGEDGTSVRPVGTVTDSTALPASADRGEGYVTEDTGHMWVWSGTDWVDVGPLQGPPGEPGRDGVSTWGAIEGKPDVFPPEPHRHTWEQVDEKPATFPPTIGTTPDTAAPGDHSHTAADVGAAPADHSHTPASIGAAPADHSHPEYATTEQVNVRTPEIRVVSSPDQATTPGVLYVVMEG